MTTELTALSVYTKELRNNDRYNAVSKDIQMELIQFAKDGDESAKEILIETNLLFVLHEARKYTGMGLMLEELNSLGIEGLIMAIDKYKIGSNASFTSVAKLWIKHKITRDGLFKRNIVKIPENQLELQKDGRYTGTYYSQTSFDNKNEDCEDLHEVIADKDTLVDSLVFNEEQISLKAKVDKRFSVLSELETKIIKMQFGFDDNQELSIKEIAETLEMCHKEVKSISNQALQKMKF